MKYLFAILIPPLGLAMAGKPGQAVLCLVLCCTIIGWVPAAIWACCVVGSSEADERTNRMVAAISGPQPPTASKSSAPRKYNNLW